MDTKQVIGLSVILVVLVGAGIYLFKRRKSGGKVQANATGAGNCIKVPSGMETYNPDTINWGGSAPEATKLFGDWDSQGGYILGFLKGCNVQLSPDSQRYFKQEIKEYLAHPKKLQEPNVAIGQFRCDRAGALPY